MNDTLQLYIHFNKKIDIEFNMHDTFLTSDFSAISNENKLHIDEMMVMSDLYRINTLKFDFHLIVLPQ